jgi:hypothetical protein
MKGKFECETCHAAFKRESDLKRHQSMAQHRPGTRSHHKGGLVRGAAAAAIIREAVRRDHAIQEHTNGEAVAEGVVLMTMLTRRLHQISPHEEVAVVDRAGTGASAELTLVFASGAVYRATPVLAAAPE